MIVTFIDAHRAAYRVEPIRAVLPVAPATFHAHKARHADPTRLPAHGVRACWLKTQISHVWTEQHGAYGSCKV